MKQLAILSLALLPAIGCAAASAHQPRTIRESVPQIAVIERDAANDKYLVNLCHCNALCPTHVFDTYDEMDRFLRLEFNE